MSAIKVGVCDADVALVSDDAYRSVLGRLLDRARRRVFASIFLIDIDDVSDDCAVMETLLSLRLAVLRGVDVRVMIGGAPGNLQMSVSAKAARTAMQQLGVPCLLLADSDLSSHKKLAVLDDNVLLGSHNWSKLAFAGSTQDSLLIANSAMAEYCAQMFAREWKASTTGAHHGKA